MSASKFLIKVCGMRNSRNIEQIAILNPDFIGFVFYPHSPRYVRKSALDSALLDTLLPKNQSKSIKRVGVFVESVAAEVERTARLWELDYVQLHGKESPSFCKYLKDKGFKVIKVFPIGKEGLILQHIKLYEKVVDYFLFDTQTPKYGGSGKKFDWNLLQEYDLEIPFMLSGGIAVEDAPKLKNFSHQKCIGFDINSRFETEPALKNPVLVKDFITTLRS